VLSFFPKLNEAERNFTIRFEVDPREIHVYENKLPFLSNSIPVVG